MNNWIEVSDAALTHNFQALQAAAGSATEVLAVIKANAYGHGAEHCAPVLVRAGARWLGVTCAEEGARVRRALDDLAAVTLQPEIVSPDLLVMCGPLPEDGPILRAHRLTPVIWTPEQAGWLAGDAAGQPSLPVHIEVDTGMSRQGARPGRELDRLLKAVAAAGLELGGVFTHYASAEVAGSALTRLQQRRFEQAVTQVIASGARPAWVHAGNSSSMDNPAQPWPTIAATWLEQLAAGVGARAMVRPGLALYGYCLPIEGPAQPHIRPELQPALHWKARVLAVRELATGETVGYNAIFTAPGPMRVAVLPVGYADGLRRELSSTDTRAGGWVMLHGRRAPILGRISMNLTVVDVTGVPQAAALDVATLLGPGITADDHARLTGTIPYEILCGIHPCG